MISVSFVYARRASGDGLRAPPLTVLPSPNAPANGVTSSATSSALARIHGPRLRPLSALRMRVRIRVLPPGLLGAYPCLVQAPTERLRRRLRSAIGRVRWRAARTAASDRGRP